MARRSSLVSSLLTYGVRVAPVAYAGLRRVSAKTTNAAVPTTPSRRSAEAMAREHALHLVDGSILPVYDGDTRVWVVFSGETVVGTHPVTATPPEELLAHYDLATRIVPAPRGVGRPAPRRRAVPRS